MNVVRGEDRPPLHRPSPLPTLQRLIDQSSGSTALTVLVNELVADQCVPDHTHDVEEVLLVTAGQCRVEVGGDVAELRAGDAVVVPPNAVHCFHHLGASPATVIAVLAGGDAKVYWHS